MSKYIWLALLGPLFLLGCSAGNQPGAANLGQRAMPPAAHAAAPDAPVSDFSVTGRLLVVKEGSIYQWSQGGMKKLVGGEHYQNPAFSPDGTRIAASILGDNHSDLVLLDASGKRILQLTENWSKARLQDSAWARHPTWSPDGRRIAYASDVVGSQMSLWGVDITGSNRRQMLPAPGWGGIDWPSWAPNGRDILLTSFEANNSQLLRFNLTAGTTKKLSDQRDGAYDPAWSPDGEHIAFVVRTEGRNDIWLMDSDGGSAVRLTDTGTARAPAWSPEGSVIAFLADQGRGFDLYAMSPSLLSPTLVPTSAHKRLTNGQNVDATSGVSWGR